MAEATDTRGIIFQNLKDAGCDKQLTEQCMSFVKKRRRLRHAADSHKIQIGTAWRRA